MVCAHALRHHGVHVIQLDIVPDAPAYDVCIIKCQRDHGNICDMLICNLAQQYLTHTVSGLTTHHIVILSVPVWIHALSTNVPHW